MRRTLLILAISLTTHMGWTQPASFAGSTDFNPQDRLAITNLIHAYAFHWDSRNVDEFLSLFTDDADSVSYSAGQELKRKIKEKSAVEGARERADYFQKNQMQRRHIMSSTLFLQQAADTAEVLQYCLLVTTDATPQTNPSATESAGASIQTKIVSPIVYRFEFSKFEGAWKIRSREIQLDASLDVP